MPISVNKSTPKLYVKGISDEVIISEVKASTNAVYPENEGKVYINVSQVIDHIRENDSKYTTLNLIKTNQYLKSTISYVYGTEFKWERYNRKESKKSIYIRSKVMED